MKKMAIMKGVDYGCRDVGSPVLWFSAHDGDTASLQVLSTKEANEVIEKSGVKSIRDLEGKPCWIEVSGMQAIFAGLVKL